MPWNFMFTVHIRKVVREKKELTLLTNQKDFNLMVVIHSSQAVPYSRIKFMK